MAATRTQRDGEGRPVQGKAEPQGGTTAQVRTWYVYLVRAQNGALY